MLNYVALRRPPDVDIGPGYLRRWWVIPRNRFFNIYLHEIRRSDDDRALHDHPWINLSILLAGSYVEHTESGAVTRKAGELVVRGARHAHRLEIIDGRPCWTLFITGPRIREWGFHCPAGWRPWQQFTDKSGAGIGRGCGEGEL